MTTLTLNEVPNFAKYAIPPSMPAFMEGTGTCVVLTSTDHVNFIEHWCVASAFISGAQGASKADIRKYFAAKQPKPVPAIFTEEPFDFPEPISTLDAEAWAYCTADDDFDLAMVA